ncbi:hypothetical protein CSA17_01210 [bacterium DOLJORAL78_65_58]|nr:MAG: hypothetical protein CSB20_01240 [bacterium DOLZORAL124_64_63]PIE76631.1 MAG: hypothetical protein CSA17_01210 [bacterium DOLJORAL78_65_58]
MILTLLLGAMISGPVLAQAEREDAIWARTTSDPITLDGVLDEAAWADAETWVIDYAQDAGIPGSGWKTESGWQPVDPTHATIKFLIHDNQLYMGAYVEDQSIGGSAEFNRFDGLLMGMKDRSVDFYPTPQAEYMYTWWHDELSDPQPVGTMPGFIGAWAELPHGSPRTPEQIAAWDAVTVVDGTTNDDATPDVGYTVEMRFNLAFMGYNANKPEGEIIEWNISIYDTDWYWPISTSSFSSNRVWWQGPWGNTSWYNEVRIHARPDVTVGSGPAPSLEPEVIIPAIDAEVTIDGQLNEAVWSDPAVYSFDIRWDDFQLVAGYDAIGPYRAGQYQPEVNGGEAFVIDPADATVKIFHRGDTLYMGFESRDQVVQFHPDLNRWDGFIVTVDNREERGSDNQLLTHRLSFQVGPDGTALPQDDLLNFVNAGDAEVALFLPAGTSVDTLGQQADNGYSAEFALDLKAIGYPAGLGDGAFFFGVLQMDGDSFIPTTDSYGTRTWWYREFPGACCPVWAHLEGEMSPVIGDLNPYAGRYARLLSQSGPSSRPQVSFAMPERNNVQLEIFDVRGRLVQRRALGTLAGGENTVTLFRDQRPGDGLYLYRLQVLDPATGALRGALTGKTLLLK